LARYTVSKTANVKVPVGSTPTLGAMKKKSKVSDDLPKRFEKRTEFINKRYSGYVSPSGVSVVRIVQSIVDENNVLIHMKWDYNNIDRMGEMRDLENIFSELSWIKRELKNYFLVNSDLRRVFY
jgi:hypothetical protein